MPPCSPRDTLPVPEPGQRVSRGWESSRQRPCHPNPQKLLQELRRSRLRSASVAPAAITFLTLCLLAAHVARGILLIVPGRGCSLSLLRWKLSLTHWTARQVLRAAIYIPREDLEHSRWFCRKRQLICRVRDGSEDFLRIGGLASHGPPRACT